MNLWLFLSYNSCGTCCFWFMSLFWPLDTQWGWPTFMLLVLLSFSSMSSNAQNSQSRTLWICRIDWCFTQKLNWVFELHILKHISWWRPSDLQDKPSLASSAERFIHIKELYIAWAETALLVIRGWTTRSIRVTEEIHEKNKERWKGKWIYSTTFVHILFMRRFYTRPLDVQIHSD